MRRLASGAIASVLALLASSVSADEWPVVPLPEDSRGEWVSRHMIFNGLHMRAIRIDNPRSPAEVTDFYKKIWKGTFVEDKVGDDVVIGHMQDGHYITVDVAKAGGRTQGNIGVTRVPDAPPPTKLGRWLAQPAGSRVFNDIEYLDVPEPTRTLTFGNALSPYQNHQFYQRRLLASGWRPVDAAACTAAMDGCAARFEKGGQHMSVTFSREAAGSVVIANQTGG